MAFTPPGTGINIQRSPGASPPTASPLLPAPAAQTNPPAPSAFASPSAADLKCKWTIMHDELSAALPEVVYDALDANGPLGAAARAKLQKAFRKSASGAIFDPAVCAPFRHQFRLALAEGAYFDPVKRGLALAVAGRSAGPETGSVNELLEATGRRSVLHEYRDQWTEMEPQFGSGTELSCTNVQCL